MDRSKCECQRPHERCVRGECYNLVQTPWPTRVDIKCRCYHHHHLARVLKLQSSYPRASTCHLLGHVYYERRVIGHGGAISGGELESCWRIKGELRRPIYDRDRLL